MANMRTVLPNGLEVTSIVPGETVFLYEEIFEGNAYLRNGIEVHDNDVVFDAGANIGMFTLLVYSRCKPKAVFSFEPMPPIYAALSENVGHLPGAHPMNVAVGASRGSVEITYYPSVTVMSTAHPSAVDEQHRFRASLKSAHPDWNDDTVNFFTERAFADRKTFTCQVTTISDVARDNAVDRIDLLKVDVEKFEAEVFRGIDEETWTKIRQVVTEVHDVAGRADALIAEFEQRGFVCNVWRHRGTVGTDLVNVYAIRSTPVR